MNSASFGAGKWQISATTFDSSGRVVTTLSPNGLAASMSGAACADPIPALVCSLPSQQRASLLSTVSQYSPSDAAEVTDTFGPTTTVTLPDGSAATSREHTHKVYDEGAPVGLAATLGLTKFRLPTTVTTAGYIIDGAVDPTSLTQGVDRDTRTTINSYDPIDGASSTGPTSGWVVGQPTSVSSQVTVAGGASQNIGARTLFDAAGRVVQERQPLSGGADQGTRITVYYSSAPNALYPQCGTHPEWDDLICQTGLASLAATAPPPQSVLAYSMTLAPTSVSESSGGMSRLTTTQYDTSGRTKMTTIAGSSQSRV